MNSQIRKAIEQLDDQFSPFDDDAELAALSEEFFLDVPIDDSYVPSEGPVSSNVATLEY